MPSKSSRMTQSNSVGGAGGGVGGGSSSAIVDVFFRSDCDELSLRVWIASSSYRRLGEFSGLTADAADGGKWKAARCQLAPRHFYAIVLP